MKPTWPREIYSFTFLVNTGRSMHSAVYLRENEAVIDDDPGLVVD